MKEQKRKETGITLIALVISIIVMMILAGVSLNMTIGDNGIITKAQMASIAARFAKYLEEFEMNTFDDIEVYASGMNLKRYIPSIENQDADKFAIIKSKLIYIGIDEKESEIASTLGLGTGSADSSDATTAITEIHTIIEDIIVPEKDPSIIPLDDSQLLDEQEHTNTEDGLIGTRLFDRSGLNLINKTWNILIEYDKENNEKGRYGSGYYWLKKGNTYTIDGKDIEFKNDYVVNYSKNEYTILSGRAVNWNENTTLAVTEGLALNIDPMSLADGEWRENAQNSNFYDFYVQNPITFEWTNTGVQKTGDVIYDSTTKALKFNEDRINNPNGEDGYLKFSKPNLDFSNGFTFEFYGNLSRLSYTGYGHIGSSAYGNQFLGLFCRDKSPFSSTGMSDPWAVMRFGMDSHNIIWADFCDFRDWEGTGLNLQTQMEGDITGLDSAPTFAEVNKDFYMTVIYVVYKDGTENEYYDDYMREHKNVDKVLLFLDGNLYGYTYYGHSSFVSGLSYWNNDSYPFIIGCMKMGTVDNVRFLRGLNYSSRLYQKALTALEVKENYNMTLKYRSSF